MARQVSIGTQSFEKIRAGGHFLVDKTAFISDWWLGGDDVTLVCRPRRFGKTLTLSMAECFFSTEYAGRGGELFGGLAVWEDPRMRGLQGTVPVIMLSFADAKAADLDSVKRQLKSTLCAAVRAHGYLAGSDAVDAVDRAFLQRVSDDMDDVTATTCLKRTCAMLHRHWGVKPVVLLDEYDTPMQEAWLNGYWDGMSTFMRNLFNATFKTNPALGRGLITGVTRITQESIFSDLNNLRVVSTITPAYEDAFGFTEGEVAAALAEFGIGARMDEVRDWYDGFTFGNVSDIYNPWSITSFLKERKLAPYWMNTSSNGLVSSLVRRSGPRFKGDFEGLLAGGTVVKRVDEHVQFRRLDADPDAVWTLLLATGYLKVVEDRGLGELVLGLTNREVREGFGRMVSDWFLEGREEYNDFVSSLLACDADGMTGYLSDLAYACMSSFDSGRRPSRNAPERFWHGLVLGLLVELRGRYEVRSNPESGRGRCDVMLAPLDGTGGSDPAFVLEFKVLDARRDEKTLEDTVAAARAQIAERGYEASLVERGIEPGRIHSYGIAFEGSDVLVG